MPTHQYNQINKRIIELKQNQVFVYGANASGFHGAGAAGQAMRGDPKNTWRQDPAFLKAMRARPGSPDRIGKWAVFGVARGFQQGREGCSYAIETIERPGMRRSTPLETIKSQMMELLDFAKTRPELEFLMTPVGGNLAGYTHSELAKIWKEATQAKGLPPNIKLPKGGLYEPAPMEVN